MNLEDQIGSLEAGIDQLIQFAAAARTARQAGAASEAQSAPRDVALVVTAPQETVQQPAVATLHAVARAEAAPVAVEQPAEVSVEAPAEVSVEAAVIEPETSIAADKPILEVSRPSQNEITMTIGGQTVSLHSLQVGQLIEELANARASMTPEPPPGIPPGWRFASTRNPVMAVQKQANGERLLVLRHTGHGWVPFTFSPDMVIQMYMMLTQR